jgi:uncharacterized protein YbjQ (UPF0145 family)
MKTAICCAVVSLALGACGPFIPVTNVDDVSTKTMAAADSIRIVRTGENIPTVTLYLGRVEGNSCKNKVWDKAASADEAMLRIRVAAANRGANTVIDLTCDGEGTSLLTNCWASVQCKGVAVKATE